MTDGYTSHYTTTEVEAFEKTGLNCVIAVFPMKSEAAPTLVSGACHRRAHPSLYLCTPQARKAPAGVHWCVPRNRLMLPTHTRSACGRALLSQSSGARHHGLQVSIAWYHVGAHSLWRSSLRSRSHSLAASGARLRASLAAARPRRGPQSVPHASSRWDKRHSHARNV